MDGVGEQQTRPETWQAGVHRTPPRPQASQRRVDADSEPSRRKEKRGGQGRLGRGVDLRATQRARRGTVRVNNSVSNSGPSCCARGPQSRPLRRTPVSPSLDRRGHRGPERRGVPEVLTPTHLLFLVYLLSHPTRERWGKQRPRAAGNWLLSARGKPRGPDSRSGAPPRSSCPMLSRGAPNFTKPAHWG